MLRIIRGAGKPHEAVGPDAEHNRSCSRFRVSTGTGPQDVITNDLRVFDELHDCRGRIKNGTLDEATYDRWWDDGTFEVSMAERRMYRGALQMIASELIGQSTQQRAGESEFHEGLFALEKAREKRQKAFQARSRAAKAPVQKTRKPIDLGPGPIEEGP